MDPVKHCNHLVGEKGACCFAFLWFMVNALCHGFFFLPLGVIGRIRSIGVGEGGAAGPAPTPIIFCGGWGKFLILSFIVPSFLQKKKKTSAQRVTNTPGRRHFLIIKYFKVNDNDIRQAVVYNVTDLSFQEQLSWIK